MHKWATPWPDEVQEFLDACNSHDILADTWGEGPQKWARRASFGAHARAAEQLLRFSGAFKDCAGVRVCGSFNIFLDGALWLAFRESAWAGSDCE